MFNEQFFLFETWSNVVDFLPKKLTNFYSDIGYKLMTNFVSLNADMYHMDFSQYFYSSNF